MMPKKTSGRRKIELKKIEKKKSLHVTFSKRRSRLFKKAAELCVLTGAEVAIIVQSPGNHVFAFGHRDVDSLIETYLGNNNVTLSENPMCMHEEDNKYLEIVKELEVEKSKSNDVVEESGGFWWENSFKDLEMDELEIFIKSLEELKNKVKSKADELRNSVTSPSFINTNGADELRNSVASSSLINTNGADELWNLLASSPFDTNTNLSNVDGLLDDHVNLPDIDQFLPTNIGVTNEELMMMQAFDYNSGGFNNNYTSGNGELALDNHDYVNHGGNNYQVPSDFGVPDDYFFGQGQI